MTETIDKIPNFWDRIFPNTGRGQRFQGFVERVSSSLDRLQEVILIRFQGGKEILYLVFDPKLNMGDVDNEETLMTPVVIGGDEIVPMEDLQLTERELSCITLNLNDSFYGYIRHVTDWPFTLEMTREYYQHLRYSTENLRKAEHITLWQRQIEPVVVLEFSRPSKKLGINYGWR